MWGKTSTNAQGVVLHLASLFCFNILLKQRSSWRRHENLMTPVVDMIEGRYKTNLFLKVEAQIDIAQLSEAFKSSQFFWLEYFGGAKKRHKTAVKAS